MQFVADLHLHSKYSRAVSQDMVLPTMAYYAKQKGLDLLTASDFTHPLWLKELKAQLEEAHEGLYRLKGTKETEQTKETLFLLSTEIASIYKQGDKLRRIHNLIFAPSFEVVEKINKQLTKLGCNLHSDGRPIIGLSSKQLLSLVLEIEESCMLIPCHVWTPHFGIYGSASGFDSLEEAFGELSSSVYGIETGLSSDPEMNWQMEELMDRSILSFSDAHSPAKMGREATVFGIRNQESGIRNQEITYKDIAAAIKRDPKSQFKVIYTIEFYPEEGKYHFSGHRNCKVVFGPAEIEEKGTICPVCKKRLTEGVLLRVGQLGKKELARRVSLKISPSGIKWYTDSRKIHPPFVKLVPLQEILAESLSSTVFSQKVKTLFTKLCDSFGSEIEVLLKIPVADLAKVAGEKVAQAVGKVREGNIVIEPGYDGEYGKVKIWNDQKETVSNAVLASGANAREQMGLF